MCCVSIKNYPSSISNIRYGVPQGSILGPILFSINMLPLGEVIRRHGISFHFYADDSQLYLPIKPNDPHMLSALHECLNDIKSWMALHFLQLNYRKNEILVIGPRQLSEQIMPSTGDLSKLIKPVARSLGVLFDSNLCFEQHITKIVQSCFYQLRNICKIRSILNQWRWNFVTFFHLLATWLL